MTILNLMKRVEKFSKKVENALGKGEIGRYGHFLLFLQCFRKACTMKDLYYKIEVTVQNNITHISFTIN